MERLVKKYLNKEGLEVGEVFKYIERTRVQLRPPLLHFLLGQTHRMRLLKKGDKTSQCQSSVIITTSFVLNACTYYFKELFFLTHLFEHYTSEKHRGYVLWLWFNLRQAACMRPRVSTLCHVLLLRLSF